jgi:hypothetical protein
VWGESAREGRTSLEALKRMSCPLRLGVSACARVGTASGGTEFLGCEEKIYVRAGWVEQRPGRDVIAHCSEHSISVCCPLRALCGWAHVRAWGGHGGGKALLSCGEKIYVRMGREWCGAGEHRTLLGGPHTRVLPPPRSLRLGACARVKSASGGKALLSCGEKVCVRMGREGVGRANSAHC